jgi:hypothetical protein
MSLGFLFAALLGLRKKSFPFGSQFGTIIAKLAIQMGKSKWVPFQSKCSEFNDSECRKLAFVPLRRLFAFLFCGVLTAVASRSFAEAPFASLKSQPPFEQAFESAVCADALSAQVYHLSKDELTKILDLEGNSVRSEEVQKRWSRRAIEYLRGIEKPTQIQLVTLWEQFANFIIDSNPKPGHWDCSRLSGSRGEVIYVGKLGHAISFSDGHIYKGQLTVEPNGTLKFAFRPE